MPGSTSMNKSPLCSMFLREIRCWSAAGWEGQCARRIAERVRLDEYALLLDEGEEDRLQMEQSGSTWSEE